MTSSNWNSEPDPSKPREDTSIPSASDPAAGSAPDASGAPSVGSAADPYGQSGSPVPQWASSPAPAGQPSPAVGVPGHGAPGYGAPAGFAVAPPTSGMAVAGFVVSLVSLFLCAGITAPVALILSILGMKKTAPDAQPPAGGRGLAIAGVVISGIGVAILALFLIWIIGFAGLAVLMGTSTSTS
ncbi:DUF4190 domain-containing protein [Brachybacterium squillarum]|uniref:DUF4190 domain-containing protein n=1 Tax=Brachybacterium squillarum TaxID=661979 RepID=UPI00026293D1|nr:DUF4190 domain-containing protein [Brachybacterium squillarum]